MRYYISLNLNIINLYVYKLHWLGICKYLYKYAKAKLISTLLAYNINYFLNFSNCVYVWHCTTVCQVLTHTTLIIIMFPTEVSSFVNITECSLHRLTFTLIEELDRISQYQFFAACKDNGTCVSVWISLLLASSDEASASPLAQSWENGWGSLIPVCKKNRFVKLADISVWVLLTFIDLREASSDV